MSKVVRFGVSLPAELIERFDKHIDSKGYRTSSEAIRDIMRERLVEEEWESDSGEVVGTVTIVYDHHTRELSSLLTDLQHEHHEEIICSTHIHLDAHNCLEVIMVKGSGARVRKIADLLVSTRGVKHGKLVCTTTGKNLL
jgi:CopG family nickel-responsive transcriptional regulator